MKNCIIKPLDLANDIFLHEVYRDIVLSEVLKAGDRRLSQFEDVAREIWCSLFYLPGTGTKIENPTKDLNWAIEAIAQLTNDPNYESLCQKTAGDTFKSSVALYELMEKIVKGIPELKSDPEEIQNLRDRVKDINKQLQQLQKQQRQLQQQEQNNISNDDNSQTQPTPTNSNINDEQKEEILKSIAEKMKQLADERSQIQQEGKVLVEAIAQEQADNMARLSRVLQSAMERVNEEVDLADAFSESFSWGIDGDGSLSTSTPNVCTQMQIYHEVKNKKLLLEIIKEAGRMKRICNAIKQKTKVSGEVERVGITYGKDIRKVVPQDLMLLGSDRTKPLFSKKLIENSLREYDTREKSKAKGGDVIIFRDCSGSTVSSNGRTLNNIQINNYICALVWALTDTINRQGRTVKIQNFDYRLLQTYDFEPRTVNEERLLDAIAYTPDPRPGTLWDVPLNSGVEFVKQHDKRTKFSNKKNKNKSNFDFILITDGNCAVNKTWADEFNQFKKQYGVTLYTIIVTAKTETAQDFSDRVITIDDIYEDDRAKEVLKLAFD